MGGAAARVGPHESGARRGTEGAEDVALAAPAVVDLLPGPARGWQLWPNQVSARVALSADGAHRVQADNYAAIGRCGVERLDAPFFRELGVDPLAEPGLLPPPAQTLPEQDLVDPAGPRGDALVLQQVGGEPVQGPRREGQTQAARLVSAAAITAATWSAE